MPDRGRGERQCKDLRGALLDCRPLRIGPLRQRPLPRGTTLGDQAAEWSTAALLPAAIVALGIANGGYSTEAVAISTVVVWVAVAAGIVVGVWRRSEVSRAALVACRGPRGPCVLGRA